jgi:hypothetical protein
VTFIGVTLILVAAVVTGFVVRSFLDVLPTGVLTTNGSPGSSVVAVVDAGATGTATLEPGSYTLWLASPGQPGTLSGQITVDDPAGTQLSVVPAFPGGEVTMGSTHATTESMVTAGTAGDYRIDVPSGDPSGSRVLVVPAQSAVGFFTGLFGTLGGTFLAIALGLTGVAMTIGGGIWWWIRRHPKPAAPAPGTTGYGYPPA